MSPKLLLPAVFLAVVCALVGRWVITRAQESPNSGSWLLARHTGTIKGFLDKTSVAPGEVVRVFVSTPAPRFAVEVYRLGWYDNGASQALFTARQDDLQGLQQPAPLFDSDSGLVSASNWTTNGQLTIGDWPTGLYLLKLIASDGDQNYIPLVVRDDTRPHDFLFEHADTTDQAYNGWGGKSLYDFNSSGNSVLGRQAAVKVSFDRPLDGDGSGRSLAWELNMVRWLEANGFDVAYTSDLDVHGDPNFDACCRVVIQAGHSEYWSREMRDHLEAARDRGKGLGFFTGDTGSWAIRFEDSALGANRVQVFYGSASLDPMTEIDPAHATTHWFESPLNRPVQKFIGIGTNAGVKRSADWTVKGADAEPGLFASTGLHNGDTVANLIGYEYDGLWTPGNSGAMPADTQVLGSGVVSPVRPVEALVSFAVQARLEAERQPLLGRLRTSIDPGPNWSLYLHLRAASGNWWVQYVPTDGSPTHYTAGGADYVRIPLGTALTDPGWQSIDRDVRADFSNAFGAPPDDVRIEGVTVRGAIGLRPIALVPATGSTVTVGADDGWKVAEGSGQLRVDRVENGDPILRLEPSTPLQRVDEADSVVRASTGEGLLVAVGTIQWSWALDDYGHHTDTQGNSTPVDARLQALTRNVLFALRQGSL